MPSVEHVEKHFTATAAVRDIVIGMSDGLTVPFALAAGLTSAAAALAKGTGIIVTAGFAEIAAGSIAMGLGGYLAAKTDTEHYASELEREYRETVELPEIETEEVAKVFREYGLTRSADGADRYGDHRGSEEVGGFHDALRAGTRAAGPCARGTQRGDDRGVLHCGRTDSPHAVYFDAGKSFRRCGLSVGVTLLALVRFRLDQGALHRREAVARRSADRSGGRPRRCRGILDRAADQLTHIR